MKFFGLGSVNQLVDGFVKVLFRYVTMVCLRVEHTVKLVAVALQSFGEVTDLDILTFSDNMLSGQAGLPSEVIPSARIIGAKCPLI
jgi:hypothetical protein